MFEPSLQGYLSSCGNFLVRYLLVGGAVFWLLHIRFKERWLTRRVQPLAPALAQAWYEIRWSVVNAACAGLSTLLIYKLTQDGHTAIYLRIGDLGWGYFLLSVLLCVLGYDSWFYWQHRLLHTDWLFRHVHSVHHHVTNPTVFASFAHHPVETFIGNVYFVLFVVIVPIHPVALAAAGLYMFGANLVLHSGYEFLPRWFTYHPVFGSLTTSTYHNLHHRDACWNYGSFLGLWDRWMGSTHPEYRSVLEAIERRVEAAVSEPVAAPVPARVAGPSS